MNDAIRTAAAAILASGPTPVSCRAPEVGEMWVVDGDTRRGLVLVVKTYNDRVGFHVCHTCPEMAYDLDLIIAAGLPYQVVVSGEVYATALRTQLVGSIGSIGATAAAAVRASLFTDGESLNGFDTGLPLGCQRDGRRRFAEGLLDEANDLSAAWRRATADERWPVRR